MKNPTTQKPKLEMKLESMEKIEDRVGQWLILEEHWTENNLDRHDQLERAKTLYKEIITEIRQAYQTCPNYSTI